MTKPLRSLTGKPLAPSLICINLACRRPHVARYDGAGVCSTACANAIRMTNNRPATGKPMTGN